MIDIRKELPEIFDDFADGRKNAFLKVRDVKENGNPLIGVFCTFFPQELALAIGGTSVSLCSTSDETISEAEKDLPRNLCPLIKSSYGFAITDKCPFFYFSDLIVGETTCDGKKKMYEYLGETKNVHVMELPNTQSEEGLVLWEKEIHKMINILEEQFGRKITKEKLEEAIKIKNAERSAVKDFYGIMKEEEIPVTGLELWHVLTGITFEFNKQNIPEQLKELKEKIYSENKKITGRPRILITGCPIGAATEKVIEAVENNGGIVVGYENCGGAKAIDRNVEEGTDDPVRAIAEKYIQIGCACMSPNPNRIELLNRLIDEYKVDGVIDMHLQACQPFQVESLKIKRFANNDKNIPYISVETDYSQSDVGQLNTRIAAFIEML
ncbi:double-cubane-cluster-containing anaerobic reductase [Miniphocaeibacter massiliensis]|uniref:double-cubane-cluster-containing anaerobic reductase n=1 Tax=Miniphocaeibacter massiliensis TaxID=2041841 RepID=UPI000C074D55|nr:double-cubane-cluster-containing anaerobic reductase [Miniphocaeibacter massiliensis]